MSDDLVARLREEHGTRADADRARREAADEIERMGAEVPKLRERAEVAEAWLASYAARLERVREESQQIATILKCSNREFVEIQYHIDKILALLDGEPEEPK